MANTTGGIAIGMIMHWSGSIASIPTGWILSDGNGGSPNLQNFFIAGAGNSYNPNTTGGGLTHTHSFTYSGTGSLASGSNVLAGTDIANTFSVGGNGTSVSNSNLPPYYALAFIFNPDMTRGIPNNAILIWSGSSASIPADFLLCDGANSTIDLRNKFIIGAGSTYAVGNTGGSSGTHSHSLNASTTAGLSGTAAIAVLLGSGIYDSYLNISVSGGTAPPNQSIMPPYYAYCFIQNKSGGTRGIITGMIAYWSGTEASIPAGFALATELKDKFVIGAGGTYAVGATGGAATHNHGASGGGVGGTLAAGNKILAGAGYAPGGGGSITYGNPTGTSSNLAPYYALCYIKKN